MTLHWETREFSTGEPEAVDRGHTAAALLVLATALISAVLTILLC